ncbi:MAG: hypothetical protein ACXWEF_08335 [Solirubrobacterales bacterium]
MSPERARATWTDERLDDLSRRMDEGFSRMDERFSRVDERFSRVDGEFQALRSDFGARIDRQAEGLDALQRTLIQVGGGMIASILVAGAGIAATQL